MANSFLQIAAQLQAQADRLTALVQNAGTTVPASAGATFSAAVARAMSAINDLAQAPAAAAALVPAGRAQGLTDAAIAASGRRMTQQRIAAVQSAVDALGGEAATIVKALDAKTSVKRPSGVTPDELVYKAQQLQTLFARQGGDSPSMILQAVSERLIRALDGRDQVTVYAITETMGQDYAAGCGIPSDAWEATIANAMQARTSDDPDNAAMAQLYTALTGGKGSLQEFCALAGVLLRALTPAPELQTPNWAPNKTPN